MVPWAKRVLNPNGISIGSAIFAGLTSVCQRDRPTDHSTWSVTIGQYVVLRCGLIKSTAIFFAILYEKVVQYRFKY